jgi:hypothetical protein
MYRLAGPCRSHRGDRLVDSPIAAIVVTAERIELFTEVAGTQSGYDTAATEHI